MANLNPLEGTSKASTRWLDVIVGASAILIAVISLIVALRQSQIMERQLSASVWPYLQYSTSNQSDDGKPIISLEIENVGVGPARIHSVSMTYDDKPVLGAKGFFEACCQDLIASEGKPHWWTSTLHNYVLAPNRPKSFLTLIDDPVNQKYRERLDSKRSEIQLKVCYCSVLDECWLLDSSQDERQSIAACPAPQADDYKD